MDARPRHRSARNPDAPPRSRRAVASREGPARRATAIGSPRRGLSARVHGTRATRGCATGRRARRAVRAVVARAGRRSRLGAFPFAVSADLGAVAALRPHAPLARAVLRPVVEDRAARRVTALLEAGPRSVEFGEERDREDLSNRPPHAAATGTETPGPEAGREPDVGRGCVERLDRRGVALGAHVLEGASSERL